MRTYTCGPLTRFALCRPSIGGGAGMGGVNSGPAEAAPQVKLGRVPKNARLIEAMAQHKNAKPKPKGWLMAVVDSIYKEGVCVCVCSVALSTGGTVCCLL